VVIGALTCPQAPPLFGSVEGLVVRLDAPPNSPGGFARRVVTRRLLERAAGVACASVFVRTPVDTADSAGETGRPGLLPTALPTLATGLIWLEG